MDGLGNTAYSHEATALQLTDTALNYAPTYRIYVVPRCQRAEQVGQLRNSCNVPLQNLLDWTFSSWSNVQPLMVVICLSPFEKAIIRFLWCLVLGGLEWSARFGSMSLK